MATFIFKKVFLNKNLNYNTNYLNKIFNNPKIPNN